MLQNTGLTTGGALKKGTSSNSFGRVWLNRERRVHNTEARVRYPLLKKSALNVNKDTYSNQSIRLIIVRSYPVSCNNDTNSKTS